MNLASSGQAWSEDAVIFYFDWDIDQYEAGMLVENR